MIAKNGKNLNLFPFFSDKFLFQIDLKIKMKNFLIIMVL